MSQGKASNETRRVVSVEQKRKRLKSFIKKFRSHGETRIADLLQQMLTVELRRT